MHPLRLITRLALALTTVVAAPAVLSATGAHSPEQTLRSLREQTDATLKSVAEAGRTEAAFASILNELDALAAASRDNAQLSAEIIDARATIYADIIGDTPKAIALLRQLQRDFPQTKPGRGAAGRVFSVQTRRDEARKIHPTRSSTYETQAIKTATLGGDTVLFGHALPSGTVVHLHRDGSLDYCFLPRPTKIQGHLAKGQATDWVTTFHRDGTLRLLWLETDEVIQGVPCKRSTRLGEMIARTKHSAVEFHPNGKLARAKVSADVKVEGVTFKRGDIAMFDAEGHPLTAHGK